MAESIKKEEVLAFGEFCSVCTDVTFLFVYFLLPYHLASRTTAIFLHFSS